jgi:uncharacterized protein
MQLNPRDTGESDPSVEPNAPPVNEPMLRKDEETISSNQLWAMSLISFTFYIGIAWLLVLLFHDNGFADLMTKGRPLLDQLWMGAVAGAISAGIIAWVSSRPPVSSVLEDFTIIRVVMNSRFSRTDRMQVSLSAGVGEELLFRGAIQPLIGIWLTSFIFIAIHGYFKFRSAGHILFGILMFSLSMMLGLLFEWVGLLSAMTAHALYDLLLLSWVHRRSRHARKQALG